jgi:hypothetical protein
MTNLMTTLRLAEKAREDIYFEKRDRELIEALHFRERNRPPPAPDFLRLTTAEPRPVCILPLRQGET